MTFIDLFSGIGGFRLGMERAGHTYLGHVENNKNANKSYEAIFGKGELIGEDITKITNEKWNSFRGKVDCICAGFPCQPFSVSGKKRGFSDPRGNLFFEILRATKEIKPSYLFLENVKGLLSHDKGETFKRILVALDELGYNAEWRVFNSKNFGVPQNRERVFIIAHLRGRNTAEIFSTGEYDTEIIEKIISVRSFEQPLKNIENNIIIQLGNLSNRKSFGGNPQEGRVYSTLGISPCLKSSDSFVNCIKILVKGKKIRKLTPKEYWRLQGFPEWSFDKAKEVVSENQLYKQAGNSVNVNIIEFIANKLSLGE